MHFTIATVLYQLLLKLEKAYVKESNILEYSEVLAEINHCIYFVKILIWEFNVPLKHSCH